MKAAVVTVSDRSSRGERADATGPALRQALLELPLDGGQRFEAVDVVVVPDERAEIAATLRRLSEEHALVLTTGGTGLGPRDVTPEATRDVIDREAPGFAEEMRRRSVQMFARAILSRGVSGARGRCLILNLPGSPKGAVECLGFVGPVLGHALAVLRGGVADCGTDAGRGTDLGRGVGAASASSQPGEKSS